MDELLDVRMSKKRPASAHRRREFLVAWVGYPRSQATWEDESNILDPRLIHQFEARRAASARSARPEPTPSSATAATWQQVGQQVQARYLASTRGKFGTFWFSGTISAVHADGTVDIMYDDGDVESDVEPRFVRLSSEAHASGGVAHGIAHNAAHGGTWRGPQHPGRRCVGTRRCSSRRPWSAAGVSRSRGPFGASS